MKMWNRASRHHLVDLLCADSQHFCHLRNFQGFFAVFQNLDEFHCCNTFEEPYWSSQKHLRFAIVNSLPGNRDTDYEGIQLDGSSALLFGVGGRDAQGASERVNG